MSAIPLSSTPFVLSATALIMGGTNQVYSTPPASPEELRDAVLDSNRAFIAPSGLCTGGNAECELVAVYTPEQLRPFTGFVSMTWDESVAAGRANLDACLHGLACTATRSPYGDTTQEQFTDTSFVVNGVSQSAVISSFEKSFLIAHPMTDRTVSFVLIANENRPNGGWLARFAGAYVPYIGITFNGSTPTNSSKTNPLTTVDISRQYDGWSDFPTNPLNILASLNAVLGTLYVHADYVATSSQAQLQGHYQDTTYYLVPTPMLPLLMPMSHIPLIGMPLAVSLDAPLRVLVEAGYDRTVNPGQPTPARFGYFPNPIATAINLMVAIPTGWDDAIAFAEGDPSARPFHTAPQPVYGVGGPPVYAGAVDPYGPTVPPASDAAAVTGPSVRGSAPSAAVAAQRIRARLPHVTAADSPELDSRQTGRSKRAAALAGSASMPPSPAAAVRR